MAAMPDAGVVAMVMAWADRAGFRVGTGFGLGFLPWAPGTFGSLDGVLLAWWMLGRDRATQLAMAMLFFGVGWWVCEVSSARFGAVDAPQIVADEFLAFPLSVLGLRFARHPGVMMLALVLYRAFDIFKPWPIRELESVPGGLGIMLDDVVAASCVWLVLVSARLLYRTWRNHLLIARSRLER